jgi:hypothetical protein
MMQTNFLPMPVFITKFEKHQEIKDKVLSEINSTQKNSLTNNCERISNTDWNLKLKSPYIDTISPLIFETIDNLKNNLKLTNLHTSYNLALINCWFQQYENGDYHRWHAHIDSFYSSVYYVELPEDGAKTTFLILDKEYEFDVKEGDILSFPGTIFHCSKPNISQKRKTIISFNISIW